MDKNKKKITSAFFIMLIIVVLAVTGYYVINKKITQDAADEVKLPNTEYGKLLAKDLDTAYPKTPTEVVKLYWRFNQCMYNEDDLSNSEFEGLLKQLRRLYDDEFLLTLILYVFFDKRKGAENINISVDFCAICTNISV